MTEDENAWRQQGRGADPGTGSATGQIVLRRETGSRTERREAGGLLYRCGEGEFALFESAGSASGDHTQMGWEVEDIEATVEHLRTRGLVFEEYDFPGLRTVNGIAEVAGNYPSKGALVRRPPGSETARAISLESANR